MSKNLFVPSLSLFLILSLLLAACGGNTPAENGSKGGNNKLAAEQVLHLAADQEPPQLDSAKSADGVSFTVLVNTMEGLMSLDKNNQPVPAVAKEDPEISKDGLTYTFHLRHHSQWSDGSPVTAHDFEYAWKRALNPKTASPYAFVFYDIKNAEAYNTGKATADDVGVNALDDHTLEVQLNQPTPTFPAKVAVPSFFPQKQAFVEEKGNKYAQEDDALLYNGPFKLANWKHNTSWEYIKNEKYWDANNVKLEKVTWNVVKDASTGVNLYNTGKLDVTLLDGDFASQFRDREDSQTVIGSSSAYLVLNQQNKFLRNKKIRTAIATAIDRKAFTEIVLKNGSQAAYGYVPPGITGDEKQTYREQVGSLKSPTNPEEAKKILQEGLDELGLEKAPTLDYLTDDTELNRRTAEFVQEQLRTNLGLTINIKQQPLKSYLDQLQQNNFDLAYATWGAAYNDPLYFLDVWLTDGPYNYPKWSNQEYDQLLQAARSANNIDTRLKKMKQAEEILIEEAPLVPLYYRSYSYLWRENVKGLIRPPSGPMFLIKEAYIAK